ncbi:MAG: inositol monophosphatase [Verrucomicrobiales bacterium]|nr:inositol monophosphatase [Verrucomicrobiales bacterium]
MTNEQLREAAITVSRLGGEVLLKHFGQVRGVRAKESWASVVSEADLESERVILAWLTERFPEDGIVAEESGFRPGRSGRTWVVDPLDGTSNFIAGLPWFGVMVAALDGVVPVASAIHLPVDGVTYAAATGQGAWRGDRRVSVTAGTDLRKLLLGYSFDPALDEVEARRQGILLAGLARRVRNVRATNSMLDFVLTVDGRFGACLNHATRIWDIAAAVGLFEEAGGRMTHLDGSPIEFALTPAGMGRTFAVLGASRALHPVLVEAIRRETAA